MFGKAMSIPDECILQYFELATDRSLAALEEVKQKLDASETNPMEIKRELGIAVVNMYHEAGAGENAADEFTRMFSQKQEPDDMPDSLRRGGG